MSAYRVAWVVGCLALLASAVGLFWDGGGAPVTYTNFRGETVETFGRSVYEHDSVFRGAGYTGSDALTLFAAIPFLLLSATWHRRGSLRGSLLLAGAFAYFLYTYASIALAAAYNDLFLVYVALFAASLAGLVLTARAIPLASFEGAALPRRLLARFLIASGVLTAGIWLSGIVPQLVNGSLPELEGSTTMVTHALDLGLIVPAVVVAGLLVRRGLAAGYLLAVPLLVLEVSLLPMIVLQTIFQSDAGVSFTAGEIIGPITGFSLFAIIAAVALRALLVAIPRGSVTRLSAGVERERTTRRQIPSSQELDETWASISS